MNLDEFMRKGDKFADVVGKIGCAIGLCGFIWFMYVVATTERPTPEQRCAQALEMLRWDGCDCENK